MRFFREHLLLEQITSSVNSNITSIDACDAQSFNIPAMYNSDTNYQNCTHY